MRELLHMVVSGLAGRLLGVTGSRRVVEPVEPIRMVFGSIGSGCHHSGHSFNAYLTDFYPARGGRLADHLECPGAHSLALASWQDDFWAGGVPFWVLRLKDERDIRWQYRVSCFLVEVAGLLVGGDAQHEYSVVVCGEGVAEQFDLQSDVFSPPFRVDRYRFGEEHVSADELCAVVTPISGELGGCHYSWCDQRAGYRVVFGPRAYQRRPDQIITVSSELWGDIVPAVRDLFAQEHVDFLCLDMSVYAADQDSCPVQGVDSTCNPSHEPMMSQAFEQLSNSS